jgi:hypothetical protein
VSGGGANQAWAFSPWNLAVSLLFVTDPQLGTRLCLRYPAPSVGSAFCDLRGPTARQGYTLGPQPRSGVPAGLGAILGRPEAPDKSPSWVWRQAATVLCISLPARHSCRRLDHDSTRRLVPGLSQASPPQSCRQMSRVSGSPNLPSSLRLRG